ncbi:MAG: hypothetical protein K1X29_03690 [Bdellovibrionales bacterium]|nr:hypothetical protein [Bdellovibrionales bacterium]
MIVLYKKLNGLCGIVNFNTPCFRIVFSLVIILLSTHFHSVIFPPVQAETNGTGTEIFFYCHPATRITDSINDTLKSNAPYRWRGYDLDVQIDPNGTIQVKSKPNLIGTPASATTTPGQVLVTNPIFDLVNGKAEIHFFSQYLPSTGTHINAGVALISITHFVTEERGAFTQTKKIDTIVLVTPQGLFTFSVAADDQEHFSFFVNRTLQNDNGIQRITYTLLRSTIQLKPEAPEDKLQTKIFMMGFEDWRNWVLHEPLAQLTLEVDQGGIINRVTQHIFTSDPDHVEPMTHQIEAPGANGTTFFLFNPLGPSSVERSDFWRRFLRDSPFIRRCIHLLLGGP